jgi:hypothetical protein
MEAVGMTICCLLLIVVVAFSILTSFFSVSIFVFSIVNKATNFSSSCINDKFLANPNSSKCAIKADCL